MKTFSRIILAAVLLAAGVVSAQNYPGSRPVRILVGYTPGGGVDTAARMMAQALGEHWGANVLVENRPGAAGNIATEGLHHNLTELGYDTGLEAGQLACAAAMAQAMRGVQSNV